MGAAVIILTLLLVAAVVAAATFYRRSRELRTDLTGARMSRAEIANFLSRFASGINCEDGLDGAMHSAACYVREQVSAGSVAIFGASGDKLTALGVSGEFPLLPGSVGAGAGNRQTLEELRRHPLTVGEGFIGEVAELRRSTLVPLASIDSRFDDLPGGGALETCQEKG